MPKERVERDEEDLVRLYLTDIGQYPLLTKDDEVRLAKAIEGGNEARLQARVRRHRPAPGQAPRAAPGQRQEGVNAQRTFVQSNLRLVVSIAKKYQASGLPLLDLIQEGNLGLMHAVEKFDWRKGFKFSTYATWWIRQAITRGIANTGRTIRLPGPRRRHPGPAAEGPGPAGAQAGPSGHAVGAVGRGGDAGGQGHRGPALRGRAAVVVGAPAGGRRRRAGRRGRGPFGRVALRGGRHRPAAGGDLQAARARSTSASARSCACASASTGASPAPSRRSGEHFNLTRERIRQIEARAMSKLRHPSSDTGARDLLAV